MRAFAWVMAVVLAGGTLAMAQTWEIGPFTRPAEGNPVVKPNPASVFADPMTKAPVHWEALHTFNPAASVKDGKVVLLYRAEDDWGAMGIGMHTSRLGMAVGDDGIHFTRQAEPVFFPAEDGEKAREWPGGVEDPRLVESEDGTYVLTYTQWNRKIARLAVATSRDLVHWTKHGPAFQDALGGKYASGWSKSAGIVTRSDEAKGRPIAAKIDGKYWMYWGEGTVYLATSTDLIHWTPVENEKGGLQVLLAPRTGRFDSSFPEGGPPPVLTKDGIVLIYNGRNAEKGGGPNLGAFAYSAGEALFDAHAPAKMLARTDEPVLKPELPYEKTGQYVAGTTFSEGLVYFKGQWLLYYGCADSLVSVAMAPGISALLFAPSAFAAPNLTGRWNIHSNMDGNESDQECKFVVTDNKITGSCKFQDKDRQVTGTVAGNKVSWQYQSEYNSTPFTLIYTGTLGDSGKIAGTVHLQPFNVDGLFTATPGPASSPSQSPAAWPKYPARDPHTPGFVAAKELPDGANAPVNADGDFILGPTHTPAPEMTAQPGVPQSKVIEFVMNSTESRIYPGIARDLGTLGTPDPADPAKLIVTTSHPAPYTRHVAVYVPSQYEAGTAAPFIVGTDGPDRLLFPVLDNLIAQHRIPAMVAISIGNGSGDAQGSERGLEYDTVSGLYAEWVEKEVLPRVEAEAQVKLTHDPDGRATMGASSGGSCALIMAWYHPELYHRVLTYSGTFTNQQWPYNSETPHGAWEFHEHLIPDSPAKPIRIWMEVGDSDSLNPNVMRDNMHDWVLANERMAAALADKGYHYQFVFARNAGHADGTVKRQTLPEALEYLWQGYPISKR